MPVSPQPPPEDAPALVRLGWALRQRRQAMPGIRNREQLAERLGYSVAVVKHVENGAYGAGLHRYMTRWEQVIGLDSELEDLWEHVRSGQIWRQGAALASQRSRQRLLPASQRASMHTATDDERLSCLEWSPDQTAALLEGANTDASEMTPDKAARLAHEWLVTPSPQIVEIESGRRIGQRLLQATEARVNQLRHIDDFIGGEDLHDLVERETRATLTLLREAAYDEPTGRRLLSSVGELCQLAGWVAADAGLTAVAERYYTLGIRAAHAADDAPLAANLISCLSYLYANVGRLLEAVLLAHTAVTGARQRASATTKALLQERVAWAHARAGDVRQTEHVLGTVEDLYAQRDPADDPVWVYWLNEDEIDVMAGRCYTELHQPRRAEPLLQRALDEYDETHARETSLYESWLAEDHIQTGEIDAAVAHATRTLLLSSRVNSSRGKERVATLHKRLQPYRHVRVVKDFEDIYREVGSARG